MDSEILIIHSFCYHVRTSITMSKSKALITHDKVNHPSHYINHPSGVECITITEHFNFCIGNAIKYLWRSGLKQNEIEDLKKAIWYIEREINRLTG